MKILVIHGPNLNLLGKREPDLYGQTTLEELNAALCSWGKEAGCEIQVFQSNIEGEIVESVQSAVSWADGMIINPGGYAHTSVAIRDAITSAQLPCIEVHLTNVFARESFRHTLLIAPVCKGTISGFGPLGYRLAILALAATREKPC